MGLFLPVFLAGGLGALTRFAVNAVLQRKWASRFTERGAAFPIGTFVINVSGSFLLGLITGFASAHVGAGARDLAAIAGTGFVGAYTTFSTEEWQTLGLLRTGAGMEGVSVIGSLAASLIVAGCGLWLGSQI